MKTEATFLFCVIISTSLPRLLLPMNLILALLVALFLATLLFIPKVFLLTIQLLHTFAIKFRKDGHAYDQGCQEDFWGPGQGFEMRPLHEYNFW